MKLPLWLALALCVGSLHAADPRLVEYYLKQLKANPAQGSSQDRLIELIRKSGDEAAFFEKLQTQEAELITLGYLRLRLKQFPEAKAAFEAAAKSSTTAWPWRGLADLASAEGKPEAAAKALEAALQKESTADLLLLTAEKWHEAKQDDKADVYWQKALAANPTDRALRKRMARKFTELDRLDAAREAWEALAADAPANERFEALREIAALQEKETKYLEAAATLAKASEDLAANSWQQTQLDQDILRLHREAGALDTLEARWGQDLASKPADSAAAIRLAALFAERGKFADQRQTLRTAAVANPDSLPVLQALAGADQATGKPEEALADYELLSRRQVGKIEPLLAQAELLIRLDRVPEAITRLNAYRDAHSTDRSKWIELRAFFERYRLAEPLIAMLRQLAADDPAELPALIEQQLRWEQAPDKIDLSTRKLSPIRQAELATAFSETFQRYGKTDEAIEWAKAASRVQPLDEKAALRVADLLPRLPAAEWLEKWIERDSNLPPEAVDQRLYQLVSNPGESPETSSVQRSLDLVFSLPASASDPPPLPAPFIRIQQKYQTNPNPNGALRVARWHRWMQDLPAASASLQLAAERFPESHPLRQELARVLAEQGDYPAAIRITEQLQRDDEKNASLYERQIAFFELDRGETARALLIFQKQADENPSLETWRNLATAQGKADDWFDAFDSWTKAAALATPAERYEMRGTILNLAERLGLQARAETFLTALTEETRDPSRKQSLREESEAFANRNHRDVISPVAPPPHPPEVEASESRLTDAKVRVGRDSGNLKAWTELAQLSAPADTPEVWQEIVRRFPRDPAALAQAAEYFRVENASMAAALLNRELALGSATSQRHLEAGRLYLAAGDRPAALDHFEKAWKLTAAPTEPGKGFPLRAVPNGSPPTPDSLTTPLAALRLQIVEEISQLARGGTAGALWLPRWEALTDPAEKVTAFYYLGEVDRALDELERLLDTNADETAAAKSFFSIGGDPSHFQRVFALMEKHPDHFSAWMDDFLLSLNLQLAARPQMNLDSLHQEAARDTLTARALRWPLASLFATNQRYLDAAKMGTLALDSQMVSDQSGAALNVAYWYLSSGKFEMAKQTASRAGEEAAGTLTHPAIAAARMEWLLSSPERQKQLFDEAKSASALPTSAPLAAARYALFASLGQRKPEIPRAMERLINAQKWVTSTGSPEKGFATFVRNSSGLLAQWGQPEAASELLAQAIQTDPVLMLIRGQMEAAQRDDLRLRLVATRLLAQSPSRLAELLHGLIVETALPLDSILEFGLFFEQAGNFPAAYRCYQLGTEQFGLTDALLAGRLRTARSGPDSQAWIETCQLAAQVVKPAAPSIRPAAASQLALIADTQGRPAEAEKLLLKARQRFPENEVLVRQLAEHYLRNQNPKAAQQLLTATQIPPPTALIQLQIQSDLALGQEKSAIARFNQFPKFATELLPFLISHFTKSGQIESLAGEIRPSLIKPADQYSLLEAEVLFREGEAQSTALADIQTLVASHPALLPRYSLLRKQLARRNGTLNELIAELREEWRQGRYFAGEILIQIFLEENRSEELTEAVRNFLDLPAIGERALSELAMLLESQQRWNEAAQVYEKLSQEHPASAIYLAGWAHALALSGEFAAAAKPLEQLHQARHLLPGALTALAQYHLKTGHPETALTYYAELKRSSNTQEQSVAYLGLAQCALELGMESAAEDNLREAVTLDLNPDVARVAAEWVKNEGAEKIDARFREVGLTPPMKQSARAWLEKIRENAALPSSP